MGFSLEDFIKAIEEGIEGAKVKIVDKRCNLLAVTVGDDIFLVHFGRCRIKGMVYVKVMLGHIVPRWSCDIIDYIPYGYYIFGDKLNEIVNKLKGRMNVLKKLSSSIELQV